jgi:hypothetical protein
MKRTLWALMLALFLIGGAAGTAAAQGDDDDDRLSGGALAANMGLCSTVTASGHARWPFTTSSDGVSSER